MYIQIPNGDEFHKKFQKFHKPTFKERFRGREAARAESSGADSLAERIVMNADKVAKITK